MDTLNDDTPATLGRYVLGSIIGQGGMGRVYRARDPGLGRDVAIKVLFRTEDDDVVNLRRFRREIVAQAALSHPCIVHIYDSGEDGQWQWFAMELLEGTNLRQKIEADGALTMRALYALGTDMAGAVAEMHARGMVHRDLKPQNIFILEGGRAKIMDLGLVKMRGGTVVTATGQVVGTPRYIPPEVVRGGESTPRSDIYQLGLALYFSATAKSPFEADGIAETINQVLRGIVTDVRVLRPDLPEPMADLIMGCISANPDRRPTSAATVLTALKAMEGGRDAAPGASGRGRRGRSGPGARTAGSAGGSAGPSGPGRQSGARARAASGPTPTQDFSIATSEQETVPLASSPAHERPRPPRTGPWIAGALVCAAAILLVALGLGHLRERGWGLGRGRGRGHPEIARVPSPVPSVQSASPPLSPSSAQRSGMTPPALAVLHGHFLMIHARMVAREATIKKLWDTLNFSPFGVDLDGGLNLAGQILRDDAADAREMGTIADALAAVAAEPSVQADADLDLACRLTAWRYIVWCRLQRVEHLKRGIETARTPSQVAGAEVAIILESLNKGRYASDGFARFSVYLDHSTEALTRAGAEPDRWGSLLGDLIQDSATVAGRYYDTPFEPGTIDRARRRLIAYRQGMETLVGPAGSLIGAAVIGIWDGARSGNVQREGKQAQRRLEGALERLSTDVPASAPGLARLLTVVRSSLGTAPPPTHTGGARKKLGEH